MAQWTTTGDLGGDMSDENAIRTWDGGDVYQRLRQRIRAWLSSRVGRAYRSADLLLLLPDFVHLLVRLALDRRVPMELKTQTAAVLAYVTLPLDLIPEVLIGPAGFADDLLLVVLMIRRLLGSVPAEVVNAHWAGPHELLQTTRNVMEAAEEMVGERVWRRLQRMVGGVQ
jgi:uncharacterized membrane protein YkvA (DUF1232 family)